MKINNSLLTASIATIFMGSAAHASPNSAWPNWYVGLQGSVPFVTDQGADDGAGGSGDLEFDSGLGYGATIGYTPTSLKGFRFELAGTRHENDLDGATGFSAGSVDGDVSVDALMFNVFYDFTTPESRFLPYVGAGVGASRVSFESAALGFAGDEEDTKAAYNLMLGVAYAPELARNTVLSFGYRYFSLFDEVEVGQGANSLSFDCDAHIAEVGVRFRF